MSLLRNHWIPVLEVSAIIMMSYIIYNTYSIQQDLQTKLFYTENRLREIRNENTDLIIELNTLKITSSMSLDEMSRNNERLAKVLHKS